MLSWPNFTSRLAAIMLAVIVSAAITSCGFRLRSADSFPDSWAPVYIASVAKFDDIEQSLSVALNQRNIRTGELADSRSRLRIRDENTSLRDVLVASVTTKQLTLVWEFDFALYNERNNTWENRLRRGVVSDSTTFSLRGNANESNPEYRQLLLDLRTSLADKLIRAIAKT